MDNVHADGDSDMLIESAARAAVYEDVFGVRGCDLSQKGEYWAAYLRQSTKEQRGIHRTGECLRTCAVEAKRLGVVVPREYVFYDVGTGEHLERPGLMHIRRELVPARRIAGVVFPALDRLSRDPLHVAAFEFELEHQGIKHHYADAL